MFTRVYASVCNHIYEHTSARRSIALHDSERRLADPRRCFTCDNGRDAPADGVVEPHGAEVDVALLGLHAVYVKALHEHPGKCGHEEIMQQDGDHGAQELEGAKKEKNNEAGCF